MLYSRVARSRYFIFALLLSTSSVLADDLEHSLKEAYQGKVFVLRNFWEGDRLHYDSAGQLIGDANVGFWTIDGFVRVDKITVSGTDLQLECKRLLVRTSRGGLDYSDRRGQENRLQLDIDFDPQHLSREGIDSVFSRAFVADRGTFLDSVADYWKPCVAAGVNGLEQKGLEGCRFSSRITAVLGGVVSPAESSALQKSAATNQEGVEKVGGKVTRPQLTFGPDPDYSIQARQAGFEGTCALSLILDGAGSPRNIQITRPCGYGLDERAVATVGTWKFEPARKDGQPVSVAVAVEVRFHL